VTLRILQAAQMPEVHFVSERTRINSERERFVQVYKTPWISVATFKQQPCSN